MSGSLRKFLYLDGDTLEQYISSVEGGLLTTGRANQHEGKTSDLGARPYNIGGGVQSEHASGVARDYQDTSSARLNRLLDAAQHDPDSLTWVSVNQPDVEFADIGTGAVVQWECDVYIPEAVQNLVSGGEFESTARMLKTMRGPAQVLGLDDEDDDDPLPDDSEIDAVLAALESFNSPLVFVGEDDATEWRVAGSLTPQSLCSEVEGRAVVIGKVDRVIPAGSSRSFMTFPGSKLPRDARRKINREGPDPDEDPSSFLSGPAVTLDVLAIFR
jgi:hypothetical protein